jgi:hypothetical protein
MIHRNRPVLHYSCSRARVVHQFETAPRCARLRGRRQSGNHQKRHPRLPSKTILNCAGDEPSLHLQQICSKVSPEGCGGYPIHSPATHTYGKADWRRRRSIGALGRRFLKAATPPKYATRIWQFCECPKPATSAWQADRDWHEGRRLRSAVDSSPIARSNISICRGATRSRLWV